MWSKLDSLSWSLQGRALQQQLCAANTVKSLWVHAMTYCYAMGSNAAFATGTDILDFIGESSPQRTLPDM